jgi:hypothetical protein
MRIGRNDPCPCGSGLKNKFCCRNKPKKEHLEKELKKEHFFSKFDRVELLKTLSALSVLPENHGKNLRIEQAIIEALLHSGAQTTIPNKAELNFYLDKNYEYHQDEDICINPLTDLVTFIGGDYITFPGVTDNGQEILNNQLGGIFHYPDTNIPEWFKYNTVQLSNFILGISNLVAKRLGYDRYLNGSNNKNELFVPEDIKLDEIKKSVFISNEDMESFLKEKNIQAEVMEYFIVVPEKEIDEFSLDPYKNVILYKPILKVEEGYIVLSPSTMCLALSASIWNMAKEGECMKEVNDAYHSFAWNNINLGLRKLGFDYIEIPEIVFKAGSKAGFYLFDDNKIALVRYLGDNGKNYGENEIGYGGGATLEGENKPEKIIKELKAHPLYKEYKIFSITIISGIGSETGYAIMKDGADRILALPIEEFNTLTLVSEMDALDLWKFATLKDEFFKDNPFAFGTSALDQMKFYKENSDSFYRTDDSATVIPILASGYAGDWYLLARKRRDKHSILRKKNDRYKYVGVERKDKFMPVYHNEYELISGELKFAVEGYLQPIWVIAENLDSSMSPGLKSMHYQITEGISYWLWQIQESIRENIAKLGKEPFEIAFELDKPEKFDNIERDYIRIEDLGSFFKVELRENGFKLIIPSEIIPYLYGEDNAGERVLVRQILDSFNQILIKKGLEDLSEETLDEIIEKDVPLGMKKKFFILDSRDNLLIDSTNLKKYRYVQEYDTGKVLDQIVGKLGKLCPPIGEIATKDKRKELARNVTTKVLFGLLNEKINKYDSKELIQRLIGLNESLIREREMLRIHTPTRIACFVSEEEQIKDVHEKLSKINRTTIATRCLIEHLAAEQNNGKENFSTTDIDELLAIMDQIIQWGSIGDMIHFDLFDVKMAVLPSGRIGITKKDMEEVFEPYHKSKTTEGVTNAVSSFNHVFPQNKSDKTGKDVPEKLDKAFLADYGVSFTRICYFCDWLSYIGLNQSQDFASLPLSQLRSEINKFATPEFSENEFQNVIDYLSLKKRGKVENVDKTSGFDISDIIPWKFNRMLSLLRKPLILLGESGDADQIALWGPRHILEIKQYLAEQCQSGRLRVPKTESEIIKVLGGFAQERGDNLVKAIVNSIDPAGLIIDQECFIGPNVEFKHTSDIGDIDVLIIDKSAKEILSLESKSMSPSRNIMEMVSEVNKLFGSKSEKGWIDKHMERHEWLVKNKQQLTKKYGIDVSDYEVRSFFVTDEDMLTPHLRKMNLPLPFITRYDLEKDGYKTLSKAQ